MILVMSEVWNSFDGKLLSELEAFVAKTYPFSWVTSMGFGGDPIVFNTGLYCDGHPVFLPTSMYLYYGASDEQRVSLKRLGPAGPPETP